MEGSNLTSALTQGVFGVFEAVSTWFVDTIGDFIELFYSAETGLSFLGIMALIGIGIAVARMFFAIITSFVQMRGGN